VDHDLMQTQLLRASVRRARSSACLAQNTQAIVLLDQAGWHGEKAFAVPV
jgi:hypothetical protein